MLVQSLHLTKVKLKQKNQRSILGSSSRSSKRALGQKQRKVKWREYRRDSIRRRLRLGRSRLGQEYKPQKRTQVLFLDIRNMILQPLFNVQVFLNVYFQVMCAWVHVCECVHGGRKRTSALWEVVSMCLLAVQWSAGMSTPVLLWNSKHS